jgi:hypothetical protein
MAASSVLGIADVSPSIRSSFLRSHDRANVDKTCTIVRREDDRDEVLVRNAYID